MGGEAAEYHSKDFDWEELRQEVENDPSLSHHYLPPPQSHLRQQQQISHSKAASVAAAISAESRAWSEFHARHYSGKFFKERRFLLKEFPELVSCPDHSKLLEVGCGNGSTVLPILRGKPKVKVYACDCSSEALERTKENIEAAELDRIADRFLTFSCDFAEAGFPTWLVCDPCKAATLEKSILRCPGNEGTDESDWTRRCVGGFDFITLIFTLSAVPQQMMPRAITECFSVLKPGGLLLFRDYGLYDMTMLRFDPEKQVGFREYMRSDGTRSYFFSLDMVRVLFAGVGFIKLELDYCCVKSVNRLRGKCMRRTGYGQDKSEDLSVGGRCYNSLKVHLHRTVAVVQHFNDFLLQADGKFPCLLSFTLQSLNSGYLSREQSVNSRKMKRKIGSRCIQLVSTYLYSLWLRS
ncbi:tRNA N(3)-methylcytidine methyltransferase METTL6-like protein [Drosera capensis]